MNCLSTHQNVHARHSESSSESHSPSVLPCKYFPSPLESAPKCLLNPSPSFHSHCLPPVLSGLSCSLHRAQLLPSVKAQGGWGPGEPRGLYICKKRLPCPPERLKPRQVAGGSGPGVWAWVPSARRSWPQGQRCRGTRQQSPTPCPQHGPEARPPAAPADEGLAGADGTALCHRTSPAKLLSQTPRPPPCLHTEEPSHWTGGPRSPP